MGNVKIYYTDNNNNNNNECKLKIFREYRDRWQGSSNNPAARPVQPTHMQVQPTPTKETARLDQITNEKDREQRLGFTGFGTTGVQVCIDDKNYYLLSIDISLIYLHNHMSFYLHYSFQGYPGSAAGIYTPLKLDLGGLLVGTLVSIGAIFILPKIVNIVSGGYGYARSKFFLINIGITFVYYGLIQA